MKVMQYFHSNIGVTISISLPAVLPDRPPPPPDPGALLPPGAGSGPGPRSGPPG